MWTSFSISPSIRRETGTPVHLETISATSSASTSSLRNRGRRRGGIASRRLGHFKRLLELGDRPVLELSGATEVGLALRALELDPRLVELLAHLRAAPIVSFSRCHSACIPAERSFSSASVRSSCSRRATVPGSSSSRQRLQLDLELHDVAVDLVDLGRL